MDLQIRGEHALNSLSLSSNDRGDIFAEKYNARDPWLDTNAVGMRRPFAVRRGIVIATRSNPIQFFLLRCFEL